MQIRSLKSTHNNSNSGLSIDHRDLKRSNIASNKEESFKENYLNF